MSKKVEHTELRKLAEAATPGPWDCDGVIESDGAYGAGEDSREGYTTYAVYEVGSNKVLFDFLNSEVVCVEEEYDEDGRSAWDSTAKRNAEFIAAANPKTVLALLAERDRLREALKPFADSYADCIPDGHPALWNIRKGKTVVTANHGDLRRAYKVYKDTNQ